MAPPRTGGPQSRRPAAAGALALGLALGAGPSLGQDAPDWSELGPFFGERCTLCHSGPDAPLGLRLDSYEGAMAGSQDGPVLIPGDVEGSELIRRVRGHSQPQMPLVGDPLTEEEIGRIESWILAGLPEGGAAGAPEAEAEAEPEPEAVPEAEAEPEALAGAEVGAAGPDEAIPAPDEPVTFAQVERIFLQRCVECHSDARAEGPPEGLRLDSYAHVLEGGERLVLIPGRPEASEIVRRIEGTAEPRMPFDGPPWLEPEQIELIRRWIAEGARDAAGEPAPVPVGAEVRYRGLLTGPLAIDGIEFRITPGTRIDDRPGVGEEAEVRGVVAPDGGIEATRLRDR
jgi:mono/diheme cytochrome c family protein